MFKVGQKVVCIANFSGNDYGEDTPVKGEIYTIRDMETFKGELYLWLMEIVNRAHNYEDGGSGECNFRSDGFRPIDYSYGTQVCESLEVMTEPELV